MLIDTSDGVSEYTSVLAALKDARVVTIKPMPDGRFRVRERCDRYFGVYLTSAQVLTLADELRGMVVDNPPQPVYHDPT